MLQSARPKKSNTSSPPIELLSSDSEEASLVKSSSVASSTGSNATLDPVALDLDDPVAFFKAPLNSMALGGRDGKYFSDDQIYKF